MINAFFNIFPLLNFHFHMMEKLINKLYILLQVVSFEGHVSMRLAEAI